MAGTVRNGPRLNILNSDGEPHPLVNFLAVFTLLAGLASFVMGLVVRNVSDAGPALVITATVTGLASVLVGLYGQMISVTREQRIVLVTGMIAGFVGLAIGLSKGGFVP